MINEKIFNFKESLVDLFQKNGKRALVLSARGNGHGLSYPFHFYRQELKNQFNLTFKEVVSDDLKNKKKLIEAYEGDYVFISVPLRTSKGILSKDEVTEFFASLKRNEKTKLIFFDTSDHAISRYFDILPYVDLFLMPFTFRDKSNYFQRFRGANIYADNLSKTFNIEPVKTNEYHDELFHSAPSKEQLDKIHPSWNWIFWKRIMQLFQENNFECSLSADRPIDITCRFHPYTGWCQFHRISVFDRLNQLSDRMAVVTSKEKVSQNQYFDELNKTKISFSPFGWGEICPKDYEAMMMGCLLMKPCVEHLDTFPSIHRPYETYVPVKWDLSDLEEKVEYYLKHEDERLKIIENASRVLRDSFKNKEFLNVIQTISTKF